VGIVGWQHLHLYACGAQPCNALAGHARIRVLARHDHFGHTRGNQRIAARRRAPMVRARLQRHIDPSAAHFDAARRSIA